MTAGGAGAGLTSCAPGLDCWGEVCSQQTVLPCAPGYVCEENTLIRECAGGTYCPRNGSSSETACPSRHWCPERTSKPIGCAAFAVCTAPASRATNLGGVALLVGSVMVVLAIMGTLWWRKRARRLDRESAGGYLRMHRARVARDSAGNAVVRLAEEGGDADEDEDEGAAAAAASAAAEALVKRRLSSASPGEQGARQPGRARAPSAFRRTAPMQLSFSGLSLQVGSKRILDNLCGVVRARKLLAAMGPSGAGKSTFLRALTGKVMPTGGSVYINGKQENVRNHRKLVGFVPQEDILLSCLTVSEIFWHAANTRLPVHWTHAEKEKLVAQTLSVLGLEHVADSVVGDSAEGTRGVSGGEKKRVNIGIELCADPATIFLDEPTSGLDSSASETVFAALKALTLMGKTIVCVIHQPRWSIYDMLDDVLFLCSGQVVYNGPASLAPAYFEHRGHFCPAKVNPADFMMDAIAADPGLAVAWSEDPRTREFMRAQLVASGDAAAASLFVADEGGAGGAGGGAGGAVGVRREDTDAFRTPNFLIQTAYFFKRAVLQVFRNPYGYLADCLAHLSAGLIMGIAFSSELYLPPVPFEYEAAGVCAAQVDRFFCRGPIKDFVVVLAMNSAMVVGMCAVAVAVRTFGAERPVFWRESASGANKLAYFTAKVLVDCASLCLFSLFFLSSFYLVAAPRAHFTKFYYVVALLEFVVFGVGYLVSFLCSSRNAALAGVVVTTIWCMTSGLIWKVDVEGFVGWISYPRWFAEGLYIVVVDESSYDPITTHFIHSYSKEAFGYDLDNFALDCGMLFVLGVAMRMLSFLALLKTNQSKRR